MSEKILEVKDLNVSFHTYAGISHAVRGVDFHLNRGETLAIVGESGCGKTVTSKAIMGLLPKPQTQIKMDGESAILFHGENLLDYTEKQMTEIRGSKISMIFQDPMTALNPIMTIGQQLAEVVIKHKKLSKKAAMEVAAEMLERVGVTRDRINDYPHQFSGGMKQRAIIAMALLCNPEILIADEPTTALDVTIQAQVLEIIRSLIRENEMSMILITHDLGVVAETCDQVAIMYAGEVVEYGSVWDVYTNPKHPYTRGLFDSIPKMDVDDERLSPIPGLAPNPTALPSGCYFHPRCKYCQERCREQSPAMKGDTHQYKCWLDFE